MAVLTAAERNALKESDFALSGRRYPIQDEAHARNALARVARNGTPAEQDAVRGKVRHRYPGIKEGEVKKAAAGTVVNPKPPGRGGPIPPYPVTPPMPGTHGIWAALRAISESRRTGQPAPQYDAATPEDYASYRHITQNAKRYHGFPSPVMMKQAAKGAVVKESESKTEEAKKPAKKAQLGARVDMRQMLPPPPQMQIPTPAPAAPEPSTNIDPAKACQILKDGQVNGQPLTPAQRRLFGAACSEMQQGGLAAPLPHAAEGAVVRKYMPYLLDAAVEPGFASVLEAASVG